MYNDYNFMQGKYTLNDIFKFFPNIKTNVPASKLTSFGIGGPVEYLLEVSNPEELKKIFKFTKSVNLQYHIIGFGTNLLIKDEGIKGVVIKLGSSFKKLELNKCNDNGMFICGAGVGLAKIVNDSIRLGLTGGEFLSGIPGSVGGAVIMNSGTKDEWIGSIVEEVEIFNPDDGNFYKLNKSKINFEYRSSNLNNKIVTKVVLKLRVSNSDEVKSKINKYLEYRKLTQPLGVKTAGCIFKNPPGVSAAKLIDEAGLKGYSIGDAYVSEKHANFIINSGNATFVDVYNLILYIKEVIMKKFGIELELEVKII